MRKVVIGVVLVAVLIAPALRQPQDVEGIHFPEPQDVVAAYQAEGAIPAACAGTGYLGCIAIASTIALACAAITECREPMQANMERFAETVVGWFDEGGFLQDSLSAQWQGHPTFIVISPEVMSAINSALAGTSNEGWVLNDHGGGVFSLSMAYPDTATIAGGFVWPTLDSACTGVYVTYYVRTYSGIAFDGAWDFTVDGVSEHSGATELAPPGSGATQSNGFNSIGCDTYGGDGIAYFQAVNSGAYGTNYKSGIVAVEITVTDVDHGSGHVATVTPSSFVNAPGITLTGDTVIVQVPADAEAVETWDGSTPIPVANGTTVNPVAPTADTDVGWLEDIWTAIGDLPGWIAGALAGFFEAIALGLEDIATTMGDVLTSILDLVPFIDDIEGLIEGVIDAVVALPAEIVAALLSTFAFADFWNSTFDDVEANVTGTAPGCYAAGIAGAADTFTGTGGAITIPFVFDEEATWTPTSGVTDVTRTASVVASMVVLLVWGVSLFHRVFGKGGLQGETGQGLLGFAVLLAGLVVVLSIVLGMLPDSGCATVSSWSAIDLGPWAQFVNLTVILTAASTIIGVEVAMVSVVIAMWLYGKVFGA